MKKIFCIALLVTLPVLLSSCLSVDRKIKINKDGSGKETVTVIFQKEFYGMVSSIAAMMDSTRREAYLDSLYNDQIFINDTKNKYDSVPGITIVDIHSEKGPDSSRKIFITYEFDSVAKIGSALSSLNDKDNNSNTVVTWKNEGNEVLFDYLYEEAVNGMEDLQLNDSLSAQMKAGFAEMFKGGSIDVQIEFPYEVVSSNAASTNGNTLHWNYPLPELILSGKMNLQVKMKE